VYHDAFVLPRPLPCADAGYVSKFVEKRELPERLRPSLRRARHEDQGRSKAVDVAPHVGSPVRHARSKFMQVPVSTALTGPERLGNTTTVLFFCWHSSPCFF
jgi:hypothetical protein